MTGQSTRNQRVERLWREVFANYCLSLYYSLFYYLEDCRALDPDNTLHRSAVQFVYRPRIEHSLKSFCDAWNNHSVRTAGSCSPLQLWTTGMLLHAGSRQAAVQEVFDVMPLSNEDDTIGEEHDNLTDDDDPVGRLLILELHLLDSRIDNKSNISWINSIDNNSDRQTKCTTHGGSLNTISAKELRIVVL